MMTRSANGLLSVVLIFGMSLWTLSAAETPVGAVEKLLQRIIPNQANQFILQIVPFEASQRDLTGYFEISSTPCAPPSQASCVLVIGSDATSLSSGFHHYLKYVANCSISWWGDQLHNLQLSPEIPLPSTPIRQTTSYAYRYYMNVCTVGYSTWAWDWDRWEREIDWMALHAINAPLAFTGQEWVFLETYTKDFNLTTLQVLDLFSGPAFLPWNRMGNIQGWMGPLSIAWIEEQRKLQKKIVKRMREFQMTPILPAFSGLVPSVMSQLYPNASITNSSGWAGFPPTQFLDPIDPLFRAIQVAFLQRQEAEYGTDHLYNCDLYNEMEPVSLNTSYLAASTAGVYSAMAEADKNAIWIMQGWMFENDPYWNNSMIESLLHAVPHGKLIVLDLWSETVPVWNRTQNYFGTPFIWNMLHNFGGRSGLYGRLQQVAEWPALALQSNASSGVLVGLGLTPEAIEQNPVVYDLMMENVYRGTVGVPQLSSWISRYIERRYFGAIPEQLYQAWEILTTTVYNCPTTQQGTSPSIFTLNPNLNYSANVHPYYETEELELAYRLFLEAGELAGTSLVNQQTFQYDLVLLASQVMSNYALELHNSSILSLNVSDKASFSGNMTVFLSLLPLLDELVGTQPLFLLGSWIANATRWGTEHVTTYGSCNGEGPRVACPFNDANSCEEANCCWNNTIVDAIPCFVNNISDTQLFELNARAQLTLWGPQYGTLQDYAGKLWQGLVADYYFPRWQMWTQSVLECITSNVTFNETTFTMELEYWQEGWVHQQGNPYPQVAAGSAFSIAAAIFNTYFA